MLLAMFQVRAAAQDELERLHARPLSTSGDLASLMVDHISAFLDRELAASTNKRKAWFERVVRDPRGFAVVEREQRTRLARKLGVPSERIEPAGRRLLVEDSFTAASQSLVVESITWPAFDDVTGEGLRIRPSSGSAGPIVIVVPDADVTPEEAMGLVPGQPETVSRARSFAEAGFEVYVPCLLARKMAARKGRSRMTDREYVHRAAFELGRTLLGYEIAKVLALVDVLETANDGKPARRIGVFGHGEGGLVAFYAAALDPRIASVGVSSALGDRQEMWQQPLERNMFGLLEDFGDAEVMNLIAPRKLIVEAAHGPELVIPAGMGAAPARLVSIKLEEAKAVVERGVTYRGKEIRESWATFVAGGGDGKGAWCTPEARKAFLIGLGSDQDPTTRPRLELPKLAARPEALANRAANRQSRSLAQFTRYNEALLGRSSQIRDAHFAKLDRNSLDAYSRTVEVYRQEFENEVIGRFETPVSPPNPRARKRFDDEGCTAYEVVLDVFDDVFAYGILLVPRGIPAGEKRPVVVCQHGLEGRPTDVADPKNENPAYHQYALRLARQGFVTFAPQNPYIFHDRFRTLQRKANPLGKTLFSIIVPQHRVITDYLATLDFVDPARIAFYGLSYGGKTAMRVPPLVPRYCLSICSADFNEWVWKNASTLSGYSYLNMGEYEIFEFNLGGTFNYAEMAALIAPRPFMVERGRYDTVAPDETVAHEFAKVAHLYSQLKIGNRCRIEFFDGPHSINGKGTFQFLHEFLNFPNL